MPGMEKIEALASSASERPTYTYKIPAKYGGDIKEVSLVELTMDEELRASELVKASGEGMKLAYILLKLALVMVNGKKVGMGDGSVDQVFTTMSSPVRQLVLAAYADIHNVKEGDADVFLKSRVVSV